MRALAVIGAVFAVVILLTACGAAKARVTVPLRARQTDLPGAYAVLRARGFRVSIDAPTAISSLRVPGPASLTPHVGSRIAAGSTVTIAPGFGPIGSPVVALSHPRYRVPAFAGRTLGVAVAWASAHQMYWSVPRLPPLSKSDAPNLFDAYRVVAQYPRAGAILGQGFMTGHAFRPTPLTLTVVTR